MTLWPLSIPHVLESYSPILSLASLGILVPLSCATDLCALVYFSAQGGAHHKTVPSSFLDPLVPIRLAVASMALAG